MKVRPVLSLAHTWLKEIFQGGGGSDGYFFKLIGLSVNLNILGRGEGVTLLGRGTVSSIPPLDQHVLALYSFSSAGKAPD